LVHQSDFFEVAKCYARLDKKDPLLAMEGVIAWEGLRVLMDSITFDSNTNGGKGGRPPRCGLMMAKILILQSLYNLADDAAEFMIEDRLSFKRFIGLDVAAKSPDAKTIWLWRERVKHSGVDQQIFAWFNGALDQAGYTAKEGQIIDATFVPTHKPTGKHRKQMKEEIPLTARQAQQIDADATFAKKNKQTYHGYKNHTVVDARYKLIRRQAISTASLHDSQMFDPLIREVPEGVSASAAQGVWADSAYRSEAAEAMLAKKGLTSHVCERAYRNTPLTEAQKAANRLRSKVRARVEHVYGQMATSMGGLLIHTLGLGRARVKGSFKNLAYNMRRFVYLETQRKQAFSMSVCA
jgi:IS5 family transposase